MIKVLVDGIFHYSLSQSFLAIRKIKWDLSSHACKLTLTFPISVAYLFGRPFGLEGLLCIRMDGGHPTFLIQTARPPSIICQTFPRNTDLYWGWSLTILLNYYVAILLGFFKLTAPAAMRVHISVDILKNPYHIAANWFSEVVNDHSNNVEFT